MITEVWQNSSWLVVRIVYRVLSGKTERGLLLTNVRGGGGGLL